MTQPELERIFTYGRLNDTQREDCKDLFEAALVFAEALNDLVPESPEKDRALVCAQEAMLWADAAIAIRTGSNSGMPAASSAENAADG